MNYSIFYRRTIDVHRITEEAMKSDIFISAYNSSDRVLKVFSQIQADRKIWFVQPEYGYTEKEVQDKISDSEFIAPSSLDEISQSNALLAKLGDISGKSICIDITGFMRHTLTHLVGKLAYLGLNEFVALYSEPQIYKKREETSFSTTTSGVVRPVRGTALSTPTNVKDQLIIAVGYDFKLISEVASYKDDADVHPLFAFPSLSADMYQQSAIKAAESGAVAKRHEWITNRRFAPANDPFSTAGVISEIVSSIDREKPSANIYLAPLSTKVQTLGVALYWQLEGRVRGGVTVLLPECLTYSTETSEGLKRLWQYTVEL
ncbi:hypothetical protein [Acidovorax sp. A1169]|uniref:hypothetical protein n=1 Tax=Acidovorax sp. A1169 TaxID=3059524 RepID=UPI002737C399|nr:hypothetical protein [Acidovorax sp. A1169]MDP4073931.1 hypothetical protein [Acidovorax sp. A1169]